jgi:hypothetical protein
LGDGTGVDVDISGPVKIMDDVAEAGYLSSNVLQQLAYAIKTDKTLWVWGEGDKFSPVLIAENVIKAWEDTNFSSVDIIILSGDGTVSALKRKTFENNPNTKSFSSLLASNNGRYVYMDEYLNSIDADGNVWMGSQLIPGSEGAVKMYYMHENNNDNILFIKDDNSLWGYGNNKNGELGDGTKTPKTETAVKIADDVVSVSLSPSRVRYSYYVTSNGEAWGWNAETPEPQKLRDNVFTVYRNTSEIVFIYKDGTAAATYDSYGAVELPSIKLPQTLTFP